MEDLSVIFNALSQVFDPQLERQWNRTAVMASLIEARPGVGKNVAWDAEFSGATAAAVAEGSDVIDAEFSGDIATPATLAWGEYRSVFRVTESEIMAAASSIGSPTALIDLFGERILGGGAKIASVINGDVINGTGTVTWNGAPVSNIVGLLGGALAPTGNYAGLSRSTYPEWAGNLLAHGGTARTLTLDLMDQADENIYIASGMSFDFVIASPGVCRKYASLFTPVTRIVSEGRGPLTMGLGAQLNLGNAPGELFYKGRPVYRDKDMASGTMVLGTIAGLRARYQPRPGFAEDLAPVRQFNAEGMNGLGDVRTMTGIPIRLVPLGRRGTSIPVMMFTEVQLQVARPNSFCVIADISET